MAVINTEYYQGTDGYSDGPIEDEMLQLVRSGKSAISILAGDQRWPLLYHLSPERRNLLEWYPFRPDAELLEIGAGCGAMTGLFCERVRRVTAVELSKKRSEIIAERYGAISNLDIIAGNLAAIEWSRRFDYITVIGVLEYAGRFISGPDPYAALLMKLKGWLNPGGVILIALENKLGLKYFAGAREEHTGLLFEGIEGYSKSGEVATFSKPGVTALLSRCGFSRCDFYYPCPDYKFCREIFSDRYLPPAHHGFTDAPNYDHPRYRLFSEARVMSTVVRDGLFDLFANSFLIMASADS